MSNPRPRRLVRPAAVPRSPRLSEEEKAKRARERARKRFLEWFEGLTKRERRKLLAQLLDLV